MDNLNQVLADIRHTKRISKVTKDTDSVTITFRLLTEDNLDELIPMAMGLWPYHIEADLRDEYSKILSSDDSCCIGVYDGTEIMGFAHCHIYNDGVSGSHHERAGYLEGIFIKEEYREIGIASFLISVCEKWVKASGCKYFGSDCYLGNVESYNLHIKNGFTVTKCDIHFIKEIKA